MHDIHENPRSNVRSCAAGDGAICLKIEKLSHIMGPTPMLEMAGAYGLRPRLWLLVLTERSAASGDENE